MADEEKRKKRRLGRDEERARLLRQIERGLVEADKEMRTFIDSYSKFVASGSEIDSRLASWTKFFNEVSLVSEERTEATMTADSSETK